MTERVPTDQIEQLVGVPRHPTRHTGRADTVAGRFYILHSKLCSSSTPDLRACGYSQALDRGVDSSLWTEFYENKPVVLGLTDDVPPQLIPYGVVRPPEDPHGL